MYATTIMPIPPYTKAVAGRFHRAISPIPRSTAGVKKARTVRAANTAAPARRRATPWPTTSPVTTMPVAASRLLPRLLPRLVPIQSGTPAKPPPRCARRASKAMGAMDNAATSQQAAAAAARQRPSGSGALAPPRSPRTANERRPDRRRSAAGSRRAMGISGKASASASPGA